MRTQNRLGTWLLVIGMVLALAACGRGEEDGDGGDATVAPPAPEVDTASASGEIDVWAMGAEGEALGAFAESFMDEFPDVTVNVTPVPWDAAHDRIVNAIAGGEVPDVTMVGTTWMGEFAALGGLDPTPSNIDGGQFFEGAWNTTVVDGTSYAVVADLKAGSMPNTVLIDQQSGTVYVTNKARRAGRGAEGAAPAPDEGGDTVTIITP